jgi:3D (Asp-Asp-Asp) domain-containing protein
VFWRCHYPHNGATILGRLPRWVGKALHPDIVVHLRKRRHLERFTMPAMAVDVQPEIPVPAHQWSAGAVRRMFMRSTSATCLVAILFVAGLAAAATPARKARPEKFTALAYSIQGKSADGSKARKGTVAADPNVLPVGSKIRVSGAGTYSGNYTVVDSGGSVKGHVIDIYMSSVREAREFGKKNVDVEILDARRHERK